MASILKRKRVRGAISWDAMVRIVGYPARGKSFRTRLEAEAWATSGHAVPPCPPPRPAAGRSRVSLDVHFPPVAFSLQHVDPMVCVVAAQLRVA